MLYISFFSFLSVTYCWHTLYKFSYNIVIWHLHTLWNDHHDKMITTIFSIQNYRNTIDYIYYVVHYVLCFTCYNWNFVPFNSLHQFLPPSPSSPLVTTIFLNLWVSFSFVMFSQLFVFLDCAYKWNHVIFVFLCLAYFTILELYPLESSMYWK